MTEDVRELAAEYWAELMEAEPTWRHLLGDTSAADRFEDATRAHEDAHAATLRDVARRAEAIDESTLDPDDRVTRAVLVADATGRAEMAEAHFPELGADPVFGLQESAPVLAGMLGVPDAEVAEQLVAKVRGMGRHFQELAERHREGLAHGRVPARFAVTGTVAGLDRVLATDPADDPVAAALDVPEEADTPQWRERLRAAVAEDLRPGMAAYRDVLQQEVLPHARDDDRVGLCWLDGGDELYARTLRYYTTTGLDAEEIHRIGLEQVARLADEYRALGVEALGTSDLDEIFTRMRDDPALHYDAGEQLVADAEVAMARAQDAMPGWFRVLPQAPCAVQGTPTGPKAFYFPPASDGSRGGTFFINTDDPVSWGTFELEAMAFHEGVPGHHLQLAVADELPDDVPAIRKYAETAAYAEGWGLYSERLADEMGLYSSPVARLGMLSADSMRACRLVVDTGLHALGWSRQQAVDYMVANSPLTEAMCRPEVDRYVVTPGQATSYMIGRLEILRMRDEARQRQGGDLDIREFHAAVLDSGTLPLGVLEDVVRRRLP